jgi:hypothetical protein
VNAVARLFTQNFCVLSLVVLTFIHYIVHARFLELSYHIRSMTHTVMKVYEGEHLSKILVYESKHITKKGTISVIKVSFFQSPGWFHGLKV